MKKNIVFVAIVLMIEACTSSTSKESFNDKPKLLEQQNHIEIQILKETTFAKQLLSNGKLKALRKSDLKFNIAGKIQKLSAGNGDRIKAGQVIAVLDQFEYNQQLTQAQTNYKKSKLELQDILIGQGYDIADSANVPINIFETASIRSGFASAQGELEDANYKLGSTVLKAPFSGIIANLKQKKYELVNSSEAFCTVIDDSKFEVEFQLVESEIQDVDLGDSVKVIPYSLDSRYGGVISEINPVIDENGLITIKAVIDNPGELLEGMNVKVLIEKEVPNQLVVPKSAVVLRQNQEVLFKYVNGEAYWTYVQTGLENSDSYTVQAHPDKGGSLQAGDTVIISGNLNLAHESSVFIE